jgi:hypothetical protein
MKAFLGEPLSAGSSTDRFHITPYIRRLSSKVSNKIHTVPLTNTYSAYTLDGKAFSGRLVIALEDRFLYHSQSSETCPHMRNNRLTYTNSNAGEIEILFASLIRFALQEAIKEVPPFERMNVRAAGYLMVHSIDTSDAMAPCGE